MIGWCRFDNVRPFIIDNQIKGVQFTSVNSNFRINLDTKNEDLETGEIPAEIEEVCYDVKFN